MAGLGREGSYHGLSRLKHVVSGQSQSLRAAGIDFPDANARTCRCQSPHLLSSITLSTYLPSGAVQLFLSESKSHVLANSPLCGMSAVPYSISDRVQSLRQ